MPLQKPRSQISWAEACRQKHRVRFYNVATLVNKLLAAQQQHQLDKFIATALRHKLIVLDELGFHLMPTL